jgi:chaperonin GroEL
MIRNQMQVQHVKTHSAHKQILPAGEKLDQIIARTLDIIVRVVGGTLGPGGGPVAIERQEYGVPPLLTKDGVSVFKSLGFENAIAQTVFELIRDASVRTANEAGDGTTTATILAEAFYRNTKKYCQNNPTIPPIQVIRDIENILKDRILPLIKKLTLECDFNTEEGKARLLGVANLSANGDMELAQKVLECFDICGDEGNVTIVEDTGKPEVKVEKIKGYPITSGYEESCSRYYPNFINDAGKQLVVYDDPVFILYFGRVNDIQTCFDILNKIQEAKTDKYLKTSNVVFIATGFSESVLGSFSQIAITASNFNICPLVAPITAVPNSQKHFLDDIAAVVDCQIFDPLTKPLSGMELTDLGNCETYDDPETLQPAYKPRGVKLFESGRYRSSIVGFASEEALFKRVDEVKTGLENPASEYDKLYIQERLAKLSDGIAKLTVVGASNGELKERRDRAEDAICAVRGAIKHGCLIGGGWTIRKIINDLLVNHSSKTVCDIIVPSLQSVIDVLLSNAGVVWKDLPDSSMTDLESSLLDAPSEARVLDLSTGKVASALNVGLLDSAPALTEALKNSISIATRLGTLKGCVVFPRDHATDLDEARDAREFDRNANFQGGE